MASKVEAGKDSWLCSVEGCSRYAAFGEGSKRYCAYHCELFDRGTAYVKATPVVSNMAAYAPLIRLEGVLAKIERCVLSSEADDEIENAIKMGLRLKMEPEKLARRSVVNGIGEKVPEPPRTYANRIRGYLCRFIVDRACEQVGLPAVGKTVKVAGVPANGEN